MRNYNSQTCKINGGTNRNQLQDECIDGSYVKGTRQPIFQTFALEEPPRYQVFETAIYRLFKK